MKKNLSIFFLFLFSISIFSQGITSIYSFEVENPNDIQTIVVEMTKHFETDFAKAGTGGQQNPGATHHAVIGAIDMVSLVNGLDELFSSQEFRVFANKVAGNREILTRKTVFRLAAFNE